MNENKETIHIAFTIEKNKLVSYVNANHFYTPHSTSFGKRGSIQWMDTPVSIHGKTYSGLRILGTAIQCFVYANICKLNIEYDNEKEIHFVNFLDKLYPKLTKKLAYRWIAAGCPEMYRVVTNTTARNTNAMGDAIPIFTEATVYTASMSRMACFDGDFPEEDIRTLLAACDDVVKGIGIANGSNDYKRVETELKPSLQGYLDAKIISPERYEEKKAQYEKTVEEINNYLRENASSFNHDDDGKYGLDCGFNEFVFNDPEMNKTVALLKRKLPSVENVQLPFYCQSTTVMRREGEKACRMIKEKFGIDMSIHTVLD